MNTLIYRELERFNFEKHAGEFYNKVQKKKIRGRENIPTEGAFLGFVDILKTKNYIYLKAYKEYARKNTLYEGDSENLTTKKNPDGKVHAILITSSGTIIHEVSQNFHEFEISNLLKNVFEQLGLHNVNISDPKPFKLKSLRTFYKTAKIVNELEVVEIGEIEPNPHMPPEAIEDITQDLAKGSNHLSVRSGVKKNLKESQFIEEGLSRRSNLRRVKGIDQDGDHFDISSNGRLRTSLPGDEQRQATKLYSLVEKILGAFY